MNIAAQITKLDEAIDGVMAEQISATGRLDDLDAQVGEIKDMLTLVLSLLQTEEQG